MVRASVLLFCTLLFLLKQQKSSFVEQHPKLRACSRGNSSKLCVEITAVGVIEIFQLATSVSEFGLRSLKEREGRA